jgi:hypothetical protein
MPDEPAHPGRSDVIETLAEPEPADEAAVETTARPTSPDEARIAFTRVARELARDYRLWYGKTLRADVTAVDALQRHLQRRRADASTRPETMNAELERHGAVFSEILARALGARWVDISSRDLRDWSMELPSGERVEPFARVRRFFELGHHEPDLVAFYFALGGGAPH